ncbi:SDR family NAD(P)-dependent oxidoreductase [Castellaniella sp.]|uniref:SDR family NAD(P)-dependent oxidoreductase n=1 Tax=Castellaniella sp. TaxID=1955812 RepID=UPI00355E900C
MAEDTQTPVALHDPTQAFKLAGKLVLLTGASSGIGRQLAAEFAGAGAAVVLCARRQPMVRAEADRLRQLGAVATGLALDVSDLASIERAFADTYREYGRYPDVLIQCAGTMLLKPFLEQTPDDFDQILDTNLRGAFFVAQRAAAEMVRQGGGSIIHMASTAGIRPGGHLSSYGASKAGLIHLSRVMAFELARYKIRVNVICPGNIQTDMHTAFEDAGFTDALVKRIPQRRFGISEDLVGAALLLASDAGSYMTGSVLVVDGGQTVHSL